MSDAHRNRRSKRKIEERERLVAAPMREDERLTGPTILQSQHPSRLREGGNLDPSLPPLNPLYTFGFQLARPETRAHEARRRLERGDNLHTLYTKANTFITSEEQLNAVVERVFDDTTQFRTMEQTGENVWNLGYQTTVAEMLDDSNGGGRAVDTGRKGAMVKERYKRIAEVLTGGKI